MVAFLEEGTGTFVSEESVGEEKASWVNEAAANAANEPKARLERNDMAARLSFSAAPDKSVSDGTDKLRIRVLVGLSDWQPANLPR